MNPYNNCSHGSWLVLFFKTGTWKLEGCIKPKFFLLGLSVQNAAPAKRGPRVPVASCCSYSSSVIFLSCFVEQLIPSLSHDLLPGKCATGRGGQTWLPWKRVVSHLVSPELRSTQGFAGEKMWKTQNPCHLPNNVCHCKFENKVKAGNVVCHVLKLGRWGSRAEGWRVWAGSVSDFLAPSAGTSAPSCFTAHRGLVLTALWYFVHTKSKPTKNTPRRNSIEGSETVLDPSENWWISLLDHCFYPCAGG